MFQPHEVTVSVTECNLKYIYDAVLCLQMCSKSWLVLEAVFKNF
jgi:hypothetical protein